MRIRIIQFEDWVDGGYIITWAKEKGHELRYTKLFNCEELPNDIDSDALIVLGGPQDPNTTVEECPYYDTSKIRPLIKKYADDNRIVFGTCLGAQLIGEALGAKYSHSPNKEVGITKGVLTKEGRKDKNLSHFPDVTDIAGWHNDMPGLTKEAKVLMYSEGCPRQIIKYSKLVYGFQTHMEFDRDSLIKGVKASEEELKTLKGPYIQSAEEILSFDTAYMNNLLGTFLDKLVSDYLK